MKVNVILIRGNKKEEVSIYQDELSSFLLKNKDYFIIYESYIDNQISLNVNIPECIDYSQVLMTYTLLQEYEVKEKYVLNRIYNLKNQDYDVYEVSLKILNDKVKLLSTNDNNFMNNSEIQKLKQEKKSILEEVKKEMNISQIFLLFIKEKQKLLSPFQEELFKHYREFDLKRILIEDDNLNYALNNGNAGCITIFKDEVKKSTTTKKYHDNEFELHLRSKGYKTDVFKEKNNFNSFIKLMNEYNCCFIRLFASSIMIWTPEVLNEFQIQQLKNILEETKKIEEMTNKKIEIYTYGVLKSNDTLNSVDNVLNKLSDIKNNKISKI
jgi:hypothetical protein